MKSSRRISSRAMRTLSPRSARRAGGGLAQFPLHELEVDRQRVERVADLVGHPGGEHGQGVETFLLDGRLRLLTALRDVAHDHGVPGEAADRIFAVGGRAVVLRVLQLEGDDVEIEETVRRVEHLHVPADEVARTGERGPIQPAHLRFQRLPERGGNPQAEKLARRAVEEHDAPERTGDDDALLDGVEDRFEKPFLPHHPQQVLLRLLGPDATEAGDEFVDETGFHGRVAGLIGFNLATFRASC